MYSIDGDLLTSKPLIFKITQTQLKEWGFFIISLNLVNQVSILSLMTNYYFLKKDDFVTDILEKKINIALNENCNYIAFHSYNRDLEY